MSISKDLSELVTEDVISEETARRINDYYQKKKSESPNRLLFVFGILGALLTGLGIILIIAHNWDGLSRGTKTFFAFLPLVAGQLAGAYVLIKKPNDVSWREGVATFLFFSMGACLALVSQIYHIPGNLGSYFLTWSLLTLPLIYLMRSSMTSLLYLVIITSFAVQAGYWYPPAEDASLYWLLLVGLLPHYILLLLKKPMGNFTNFHHWLIPLSMIISLGTAADTLEDLMFIAYFSLFGMFYLIGTERHFSRFKYNAYLIFGTLGTIYLLLMLSFNSYWGDINELQLSLSELIGAEETYPALFLTLTAGYFLYRYLRVTPLSKVSPYAFVFIVFPLLFFVLSPVGSIVINLCVLFIGIYTIRQGAHQHHLGKLNAGLLIITALVICRFFDTDLSFILRGILFVVVGAGFFVANYQTLRKRRAHE